jgi:hypothetical protein
MPGSAGGGGGGAGGRLSGVLGAGDELSQALPLLPFLDGLRVREPSANPRREAIVRLLRGEATCTASKLVAWRLTWCS